MVARDESYFPILNEELKNRGILKNHRVVVMFCHGKLPLKATIWGIFVVFPSILSKSKF